MKVSIVLTLIALSCVIWAGAASSEELPPPKMVYVNSGVLCDSQHDLEVLLTGMSLNGGEWPENVPASCGSFMPEMPVPMLVIPLGWYETPFADVLVARFFHMDSDWEQYGWVNHKLNPPPEPTF